MRRVAVVAALHKAGIEEALRDLTENLERLGREVFLSTEAAELLGSSSGYDPLPLDQIDLIIALGGDGSVLSAARMAAPYHIPVLGIRLGGFGFLTEAERDDAAQALSAVANGDFWIEERTLLSGSVWRSEQVLFQGLALNDVLAIKSVEAPLPQWEVCLNDHFVCRYPSDGVLVATPTGSTAYSLSLGGPILAPDVPALLLLPLAPHSLTIRPLVLSDQSRVSITLLPQRRIVDGEISLDGQLRYPIVANDRIEVAVALEKARIVRCKKTSFYERLRQKLRWGERA
ncbi:MAG: NAD(+)/NADH kinase [Armatimonadetes bacterium]|nr:NAD(+)/NADH kinase [Armatimonadota bacterium]MDW8122374.1 NAD(+)/NADH kinase [Armatimonadota bacterium]